MSIIPKAPKHRKVNKNNAENKGFRQCQLTQIYAIKSKRL